MPKKLLKMNISIISVVRWALQKKKTTLNFIEEFHLLAPQTLGSRTIILSHQLKCELNYLYFEALYLGLPLLHNSPMISEYGYFYPIPT